MESRCQIRIAEMLEHGRSMRRKVDEKDRRLIRGESVHVGYHESRILQNIFDR